MSGVSRGGENASERDGDYISNGTPMPDLNDEDAVNDFVRRELRLGAKLLFTGIDSGNIQVPPITSLVLNY